MTFSEKVKRHWRPLTGLVIVLGGSVLALVLFLLFGNAESASKATTTKQKQEDQRVSECSVNKTSSKKRPNTCTEWKAEFQAASDVYFGNKNDPVALKSLQDVHASMKEACKDEPTEKITKLEEAIVSKYEENLKAQLEQPVATANDLRKAENELEAVKRVSPGFVPPNSLEDQFAERFGKAYLKHLDTFEKTENKQELVDLAKMCNETHSFAKKLKEKTPEVSSHKSLTYATFRDYLKSEEPAKSVIVSNALEQPNIPANKVVGQKKPDIPSNNAVDKNGPNNSKNDVVGEKEEDHKESDDFEEVRRKLKEFLPDNLPTTPIAKEEPPKYQVDPKIIADSKNKLVSIDKAAKMSPTELDDLQRNSMAAAISKHEHHSEEYVHEANASLSKLLKQGKPPAVKQATFDAWKDSGFSAVNFIDLVKEIMQNYSGADLAKYCKPLADYSRDWHKHMEIAVRETGGDTLKANRHVAQYAAIHFVLNGLAVLNSSDSAEFEKCIREESFDGIRDLARRIVTSKQYSVDIHRHLLLEESRACPNKKIQGDKLAMMAKAFDMEVSLAMSEGIQRLYKKDLSSSGIDFDVKAEMDTKDPLKLANAFNQSYSKAKTTESYLVHFCMDSMKLGIDIVYSNKDLEDLTNIFKGTDNINMPNSIIENVIIPAQLILNIRHVLKKKDNAKLVEELNKYNINSIEQALTEKSKLTLDRELYQNLMIIEKMREYAQHEDDIQYILNDFSANKKRVESDRRCSDSALVLKIVRELKEDPNDQQCSFDFVGKKLTCSSPKLQEILVEIQNKNYASKLLLQFCENVLSTNSVSAAVSMFEEQDKRLRVIGWGEYIAAGALCPDYFLDTMNHV